jgi:hypothetical protein
MKTASHLKLLGQASAVWLIFWLLGLPSYFQQYPTVVMGFACTLLSVLFSLFAVAALVRCREENRMSRAFWLSFYYTVPLAIYDTVYCAFYLDLGVGYLVSHWYLTVFYISIWLTFLPTAILLRNGFPHRVGQK